MVDPLHEQASERGFAAFNARDPEAMIAACHPDIEFVSLVNEADGTVYRGHEGIREFFADQDEAFTDMRATLHSMESHGEHVLNSGRITGRSRSAGMTLDIRFVQLGSIAEDGLIRSWRFYRTRDEALAALESGDVLGLGRRSKAASSPE